MSENKCKRFLWETITLFFLFLTVGGMWMTWILLSIAIPPLISERRITATQGGYIQGLGSGVYLLGKFVNGVATDNLGEKPIIIFGLTLQACATIAFGFSNTFSMFAICWCIMSYCQSFAGIIQTKLVCNWFPKGKMGKIFGVLNSASEIIGTLGYISFGPLLSVSDKVNWRFLFWVCGGIVLGIMFVGLIPLKAHPSEVGLAPPEKDEDEPDEHPFDKLTSFQALIEFIKSPRFWILLALQVADGPFVSLPGDWTTYILKFRYGFSEGNATIWTGVLAASRCGGVIVGGFLYDYLSTRSQIVFFTLTAAISAGFWAGIPFWPEIPYQVFITFLGLYSFFVAPTYYLAGQFFSIVFGGSKHCGFLDSLKDVFSGSSSMFFSFASGYIIELNLQYLLHIVTILGVAGAILVFIFSLAEYIAEVRAKNTFKELKDPVGEITGGYNAIN